MHPLRSIDTSLNRITMYRLVMYGLLVMAALAIVLSYAGPLAMSGTGLLLSFGLLAASCFGSNWLLGRFWPAVLNHESYFITALILGFILPPPTSVSGAIAIVLAGVVAMASKFLLAPYSKHIFNPAAFAATVLGISGILYATWWIGNPVMLPFAALFGLLVLRKLRRFSLFIGFLVLSLSVTAAVTLGQDGSIPEAWRLAFASSPLIFLGTVMVTEPLTMPPRRRHQIIYGAIVGAIFSAQLSFGRISSTPELALIIGNIFSFAVSPKYKLRLALKRITKLSAHVYDFAFTPDRRPSFKPGQYMEWTLPAPGDSRGNRRTFSIASAPEEDDVHIGIKIFEPMRGFKKALLAMKPGDTIMAAQVAGDFVMPKNANQKLAFVAGGIGITPFRSMLQHLILNDQKRDIVLFYMVSSPEEISYREVLNAATKYGVTVVPVLSLPKGINKPANWSYPTGYLTKELLNKYAPDFAERRFYLSGPPPMVQGYKTLLRSQGLAPKAIVSDYFSGY